MEASIYQYLRRQTLNFPLWLPQDGSRVKLQIFISKELSDREEDRQLAEKIVAALKLPAETKELCWLSEEELSQSFSSMKSGLVLLLGFRSHELFSKLEVSEKDEFYCRVSSCLEVIEAPEFKKLQNDRSKKIQFWQCVKKRILEKYFNWA